MKKLLFAVFMMALLTACERNADDGSFEQQQQKNELKKSNDSAEARSEFQNSDATEMDTTDPKDIIVPPRH